MFKKKEFDVYKISTIFLVVLLLAVGLYLSVSKFNAGQDVKLNEAANFGYNKGVEDSVIKLFTDTNECQMATIYLQNESRSLADVECLNKALEAQTQQAQS